MQLKVEIGNQTLQFFKSEKILGLYQILLTNKFDERRYFGSYQFTSAKRQYQLIHKLKKSTAEHFQLLYLNRETIQLNYAAGLRTELQLIQEDDQKLQLKKNHYQSQAIFDHQNLPYTKEQILHKNRNNVLIKTIFKDGKYGKSAGFIVSPFLVLTCAHAIYIDRLQEAIQVVVTFYSQQQRVLNWRIPQEYKSFKQQHTEDKLKDSLVNKERYKHDYALLLLQKKTKCPSVQLLVNIKRKVIIASIEGHQQQNHYRTRSINDHKFTDPVKVIEGDKSLGISKRKQRLSFQQSFNFAYLYDEDFIHHKISTVQGLSGSKVFVQKKISYCIGIHLAGCTYNNLNLAIKLNKRVVQNLQKWQKELIGLSGQCKSIKRQERKYKIKKKKRQIFYIQFVNTQRSQTIQIEQPKLDPQSLFSKNCQRFMISINKKATQQRLHNNLEQAIRLELRQTNYQKYYLSQRSIELLNDSFLNRVDSMIEIQQKQISERQNKFIKKPHKVKFIHLKKCEKILLQSTDFIALSGTGLQVQTLRRKVALCRVKFYQSKKDCQNRPQFEMLLKEIYQTEQMIQIKYMPGQIVRQIKMCNELKYLVEHYTGLCYQMEGKMAEAYHCFLKAKKYLYASQRHHYFQNFYSSMLKMCTNQSINLIFEKGFFIQSLDCIQYYLSKFYVHNIMAEEKVKQFQQIFDNLLENLENNDIAFCIAVQILKQICAENHIQPLKVLGRKYYCEFTGISYDE